MGGGNLQGRLNSESPHGPLQRSPRKGSLEYKWQHGFYISHLGFLAAMRLWASSLSLSFPVCKMGGNRVHLEILRMKIRSEMSDAMKMSSREIRVHPVG